MNTAQRQPAIDIFEGDGQFGRMVIDMPGNALPTQCSILTAEMVVVWKFLKIHWIVGKPVTLCR